MSSIISQSSASSTSTTEAPPVPRVRIYLTDSASEASEDSSCHLLTDQEVHEAEAQRFLAEWEQSESNKRRKVSKQLYKPVWIKTEPDSHVKTYSVLTQWKPFPEDQDYAKWNTLVRKLELRKRHIDIYRVDWEAVEAYDFDERPDLYERPGCRFVDGDSGSCGVDTILDGLARHVRETEEGEALEAHLAELGFQDHVGTFRDVLELLGFVDPPEVHEYLDHLANLGLDRDGILDYLQEQLDDLESDDESIPDEVEDDQHYVSDLEDSEY